LRCQVQYVGILRNLLHLGGHVDYTTNTITITLDQPDSPRVAGALQLLTEELNATPATMPGDHRPRLRRCDPLRIVSEWTIHCPAIRRIALCFSLDPCALSTPSALHEPLFLQVLPIASNVLSRPKLRAV
jgi:hypothetical protein